MSFIHPCLNLTCTYIQMYTVQRSSFTIGIIHTHEFTGINTHEFTGINTHEFTGINTHNN